MAYDKVVDSAKLDKALTASANALRAKTGGTGKINFDFANETGFSETITNLPTGGGDDTIDKLISREITEVTSNVTKIGDYAFSNCTSLTTANFPLVTSIGMNAFNVCFDLTTANFPLVTLIGGYAFNGCSSLTTANFPLVTSIGDSVFKNCTSLTTTNFPSATKIGSSAFDYCKDLTTADFPLVTSIGSSAFYDCYKLTTADFPSATSIGASVFYSCYSLTALILRSEKMATLSNKNAFNSCYHFHGTKNSTYNPTGAKDGYIYVPRALVDSYKAATNWATFQTQFRILEDFTVDGTITGELDPNKI